MRAFLISTLACAAVVGCGSPPTPPPATTAVQATQPVAVSANPSVSPSQPLPDSPVPVVLSPSPSPSPSLTQDQIRVIAGKAYLAAVNPANKANDALYRKYKNVNSLAGNRTYCAKLAVVDHTELLALQAIAYPVDTAADARALIRAAAAGEADDRSCAKAKDWASWNRSWTLAGKADDRGHEAANLVRLDLGLPPVPG